MDKINGNNTENNEMTENADNSQTANDSVDNQMNLSFGRKRFFGRKSDSTPEPHSKSTEGQVNSKRSSNKWPTIASSNSSNQLSNTNGYKSSANDIQNEDKFLGEGIQFTAKLIGHEFVAEARGEQMCQQSLKKLKVWTHLISKLIVCLKSCLTVFIAFRNIEDIFVSRFPPESRPFNRS